MLPSYVISGSSDSGIGFIAAELQRERSSRVSTVSADNMPLETAGVDSFNRHVINLSDDI